MILGTMIMAAVCVYLISLSTNIGIILIFGLVMLILFVVSLSKPKSLVVAIAAYPAFLIFWSIAFPGMSYRLQEGIFPVINTGFIRLRLDELVFYGLIGIWAIFMLLSILHGKRQDRQFSNWSVLLVLILWFGLLTSIGIGFFKHNPNVTSDLRFIFPSIVGLPMAIWALRRIDQGRLIGIMKLTVASLILSNLLLLFSYFPVIRDIQYFHLWHRHISPYGFTIILYSILFTMFVSGRPSLLMLFGVLIPLSLAIFTIQKWWLLGIVVATLLVSYIVSFGASNFHLFVKKIRRVACFCVLAGLVAVIMAQIFPVSIRNSLSVFEKRVLREDISGDISGRRFLIWQLVAERIRENPIIGNGLGFRLPGILPEKVESEGCFIEDHNILLWFAVRFGIPFASLLIFFCFKFWRVGVRAYRREDRQYQKIMVLACMTIFAVILSMSMVGQWFFLFEINILTCWCIAVVWAISSQNRVKKGDFLFVKNEKHG
jgi:O-antigen ligase